MQSHKTLTCSYSAHRATYVVSMLLACVFAVPASAATGIVINSIELSARVQDRTEQHRRSRDAQLCARSSRQIRSLLLYG